MDGREKMMEEEQARLHDKMLEKARNLNEEQEATDIFGPGTTAP